MAYLQVKNRAASALAADITSTATSLSVTAGEGAKFPSPGNGFHITIEDEILKCTARSTDTLTVERAQEGTTAAAHIASKAVELRITAAIVQELQDHEALTTGVHGVGSNYIPQAPAASHLVRTFTKGWTSGKLVKGAGIDADPTEIKGEIGARVKHSANQNITTGTWTTLSFDSEDFDTDDIHDNVTNNSRLTCKTAGKYLIYCLFLFATDATGYRCGQFLVNGTTLVWKFIRPPAGGESWVQGVTAYDLAVNDYVEVQAYQNRGTALSIYAGQPLHPIFGIQRVGQKLKGQGNGD